MSGILGTKVMVQVGFIVRDIESTKNKFAEFFGVPVPPTIIATEGNKKFGITQTVFEDKFEPEIDAKLAFFEVGGEMSIELIEPNEKNSIWKNHLDEKGEGIQHIAFVVDSIDERVKKCEAFGMKVVQKGNFSAGDGRYAYVDASDSLKTCIELLERW
jgi:4-hydroxyphenylpyruvate dioxygenase and related hemolysins